ncbi:MAG TPA: hypothetical protein VKS79_06780 [Gemmataceae bacterium]|nr:hypothetical protein [Gemmataceae bacterium]
MLRLRFGLAALLGVAVLAGSARADLTSSLKKQSVNLQSASALAFGPESILFIGDSAAATIYAVATGDQATGDKKAAMNVEGIDKLVADMLGATPKDIAISAMKVNPATGNVYLAVRRAKGPGAAIFRVDRTGKVTELALKDIPAASVQLPNASEKQRAQSITCMAFSKDRLFVAGLSNEEFASTLRSLPFPFQQADKGSGIEIYHGSHGRFETASPIRTFTLFDVSGQASLLAAYTCTPLVRIPVESLKPGEKVKGATVAELGNGNTPLDMVVYQKDGKTYILMANTKRGVMKIQTEGIEGTEPITKRVSDKAGLKYETVTDLKNVEKLDRLNDTMAVVLMSGENGSQMLKSVALP